MKSKPKNASGGHAANLADVRNTLAAYAACAPAHVRAIRIAALRILLEIEGRPTRAEIDIETLIGEADCLLIKWMRLGDGAGDKPDNESIIRAYKAALGGREPGSVDLMDLLPAILDRVPASLDEIVVALRWAAAQQDREADRPGEAAA